MAGAAAFDQLERRIHFIGTIDRQIDAADGVEALEGNAELSRQHFTLERRGDAHDVGELAALELGAEGLDHQRRGGTGAQTHHHAAADLFGGSSSHRLLHLILKVRHHAVLSGP